MMALHRGWHWTWALVWARVGWHARSAAHLDRWLVLAADPLELHVLHPNEDRVGCRLVPYTSYGEITVEIVARDRATSALRDLADRVVDP